MSAAVKVDVFNWPQSISAEEYLLSCCFIDENVSIAKAEELGVTPKKFFHRPNAIVFREMLRLKDEGIIVDTAVLAESLAAKGLLKGIGGALYLTQISACVPTAMNIEVYAGRINELYQQREIIPHIENFMSACKRSDGNTVELLAKLKHKLNAAEETTKGDWPEPVSAFDLTARPPVTPSQLVHGLFYRGGTVMVSGGSKQRKTYTMMAACLAVAGGHDWLGFKTTKTPVLYLNLELQDFAAEKRLRDIAQAMGIDAPKDLHVLNLRGHLVNVDKFEARIVKWIKQTGAGLVVIDPHYKLSSASGVEENSNDSQAFLLYRIETAVCSQGSAVMIAHHFAKGDSSNKKAIDRAAGGGALARWPDVVMTMTEHEQADCVTAEFALRNFAPVDPFVLRWHYPVWNRDGTINPALLKKAGRNDEHPAIELLSFLKDGMTNKQWSDASGWADGTFRRKREELHKAGKVKLLSQHYYHADA